MSQLGPSPHLPDADPDAHSGTAERLYKRLGLTGSIGAGKSTVARLLRERGLTVLDADAVARELSEDDSVLSEVARWLGPEYLHYQGGRPSSLNRPALAALVFADEQKRGVLNGILHPRVRARLGELERQAAVRGETWVVQDVPLLFEGGAWKDMDSVLLVDAPLDVRLARVMARDTLSREAVMARDAAQMPVERKRALLEEKPGSLPTGLVLDNGGDEAGLSARLGTALEQLGVVASQSRP